MKNHLPAPFIAEVVNGRQGPYARPVDTSIWLGKIVLFERGQDVPPAGALVRVRIVRDTNPGTPNRGAYIARIEERVAPPLRATVRDQEVTEMELPVVRGGRYGQTRCRPLTAHEQEIVRKRREEVLRNLPRVLAGEYPQVALSELDWALHDEAQLGNLEGYQETQWRLVHRLPEGFGIDDVARLVEETGVRPSAVLTGLYEEEDGSWTWKFGPASVRVTPSFERKDDGVYAVPQRYPWATPLKVVGNRPAVVFAGLRSGLEVNADGAPLTRVQLGTLAKLAGQFGLSVSWKPAADMLRRIADQNDAVARSMTEIVSRAATVRAVSEKVEQYYDAEEDYVLRNKRSTVIFVSYVFEDEDGQTIAKIPASDFGNNMDDWKSSAQQRLEEAQRAGKEARRLLAQLESLFGE